MLWLSVVKWIAILIQIQLNCSQWAQWKLGLNSQISYIDQHVMDVDQWIYSLDL